MTRLPVPPDPGACAGQWNAYVESGLTREERARRLAEAPAELRLGIESHVRTCFAIRRYRQRKAAEKV